MPEATVQPMSLWLDQLDEQVGARPSLDGDCTVDVAIVGAGYTGLWTAYSLLRAEPSLRVLVIERETVGFGASGRNGGWCVGELAGGLEGAIASYGRGPAIGLTRAIMDTVDEVGRVVADEGIDCGFAKGGVIRLARTGEQLRRQHEEAELFESCGFGGDVDVLDAPSATERLGATDVLGALAYGPGARVQPARLAVGLAAAVERLGGRIVEHTAVIALQPTGGGRGRKVDAGRSAGAGRSADAGRSGDAGRSAGVGGAGAARVVTDRGVVTAGVVVRATEAYTRDLAGHRRTLVPLYSLMIATEPLSAGVWGEIGLQHRETFCDDRRTVIYGQRTMDDRIAFGGRGARYLFGSRIDPAMERRCETHGQIEQILRGMFPVLRDVDITHRWGGVLGVPRDWRASVGFDRASGLARAGGYVGEGVAAANLAGRTLADLIVGRTSGLTSLPWVDHWSRRWEPEPLRWLGINASMRVVERADRVEATGRPSRLANVVDRLRR